MDITKLNALIAKRDADLKGNWDAMDRKRQELNDDFGKQQQALAQDFVQREQNAIEATLAAEAQFLKTFEKAVADLAAADGMDAGKVKRAAEPVVATADPVIQPVKPLAADVAKKFAAADLKSVAKARGLATTGGEIMVAQRILDDGWLP